MYTIIICAVIGISIAIYREWDDWGWDSILIPIGLSGGLIGGISGGIIALLLPVNYQTDRWSENLASLKDGSSIRGSFFLGCGQIENRMEYTYYIQSEDSTFKMWQAPVYEARIKYSDKQPQIHITYRHASNKLINKFAFDLDEDGEWSCIFEVPRGSIKNDYTLDAQ